MIGVWLDMIYLWLKAAHVIFVIFWMAGLFMLPRFFVYHQEAVVGSAEDKLWIARESRLIRIILNPAMAVVWVLGLTLAARTGAFYQGWFLAKLAMVFALSAYHGWMSGYAKKLARGERTMSGKRLRLANEIPGIAAAIIVILVIVKPF